MLNAIVQAAPAAALISSEEACRRLVSAVYGIPTLLRRVHNVHTHIEQSSDNAWTIHVWYSIGLRLNESFSLLEEHRHIQICGDCKTGKPLYQIVQSVFLGIWGPIFDDLEALQKEVSKGKAYFRG